MMMTPLVDEFHAGGPPPRASAPRWLAIPVAIAVVVAGTGFFVLRSPSSAEAQIFRHAFQAGETRTYRIEMDMTATPEGIGDAEAIVASLGATMRMRVVEGYEDGSGVVDIEMSDIRIEPAQAGVPPSVGTIRVTVAPDGTIVDVEGVGGLFSLGGVDPMSGFTSGVGGTDSSSSQFFFPQYPPDAIAPGDGWSESTTVPMPFGGEEITLDVSGELKGYESTRYGEAARLHHDIRMPLDMSFTMQELFDAMLSGGLGAEPPPAELRQARFVITGGMEMVADSLVIPSTSDVIQLDGTADMNMEMRIEGVPGAPEAVRMVAEMRMSIIRVDQVISG